MKAKEEVKCKSYLRLRCTELSTEKAKYFGK